MSVIDPILAPAVRVSPLRSLLQQEGWHLDTVDGVEVSGVSDTLQALTDLSTCDRIGFKGPGALDWLQASGLTLPAQPNRLLVSYDGLILARYGESEFAIADFSGAISPAINGLRAEFVQIRPPRCYSVSRAESQVAFGLAGEAVLPALAALCPADLRAHAFGPGDVLQTLCAGIGAQLWNLSHVGATRVVLLCDASLARHQWAALKAAVIAAGGQTGAQVAWFAHPSSGPLMPYAKS
jgi:sarcosine oxidase gamma subunit